MSAEQWVRDIQAIIRAGNLAPAHLRHQALDAVYEQVMDRGLANAIADCVERFSDEEETVRLFAYLLTNKVIGDKPSGIRYYKEIAQASRSFPMLTSHIASANLTSLKNVAVSFSPQDDQELILGMMLIKAYPEKGYESLEKLEHRVPALKAMFEILDDPRLRTNKRIAQQSIQAFIQDSPADIGRHSHLALRAVMFGERMTNNEESQETLRSVMKRALGLKPSKLDELKSDLDKISMNPAYVQNHLVSDFYFMLGSTLDDMESENDLAVANLSSPQTIDCMRQLREFLTRNGIDAQLLSWSFFYGRSSSMAQERAQLYDEGEDYVARHMLELLRDGDDIGGDNSPQGIYAGQWLRSLSLEHCLALKIEQESEWLKLYEVRGDVELLKKLKTSKSLDQAMGIDLGL